MQRPPAAGALLLAVVLVTPLVCAQADVERDREREVRDGATVHLHVEYEGSVRADRSGASDGAELTEWRAHATSWNGSATLFQRPGTQQLLGGVTAEVLIDASRGRRWIAEGDTWTVDDEEECRIRRVVPFGLRIEATPQADGLLVRLSGGTAGTENKEDACRWTSDRTNAAGSTNDAGTRGWGLSVPIVHALREDHTFDESFLVPYDGRASHRVRYVEPIPYPDGVPAAFYCVMDGVDWAPGTCAAEGTLTARMLVDPCPAIRRLYPGHHADLAAYPAPPAGANEALLRAWGAGAAERTSRVLADHRFFALMGCAGELEPDPWDALVRVHTMKRDALLELLRKGALSPEGAAELRSAHRQLIIMGAADSASLTGDELGVPAPAASDLRVSVHSPVSLRAYDDAGRSVGAPGEGDPDPIPGATYEGEPRGPQTLLLPAGAYRIEIEEHEPAAFVLQAEGAGTEEIFFAQSVAGRVTTTYYEVVAGWGGERLETGRVFRDGGEPASATRPVEAAPDPGGDRVPEAGALPLVGLLAVLAIAGGRRR